MTDSDREDAVVAFMRHHDLENHLKRVAEYVASFSPTGVLVVWECEDGYKAVSVPSSPALAYGLAVRSYELIVDGDEEDDDGDDSGSSDSVE
jgi:hypothetical protein